MSFSFFKIRVVRRRRVVRRKTRARRTRARSHSSYLEYKEAALALVTTRAAYFAAIYRNVHGMNMEYKKITVRNQTSRWGSCSRRGNLNFNYRVALLPPELADYIIVHELCHLVEFNHSRRFWNLVEKEVEGWGGFRQKLKAEGKRLF